MELFIDTANLEEIRTAARWGVITGVTTNPSLVAREEQSSDFPSLVKEITALIPGPVSAEVIAMDTEGMVTEARELAAIAPNVVVKIPMTREGITAVSCLEQEGIRCNVTLVFSFNQALLAARAGASFVSPFVGRIDDGGWDGIKLIRETAMGFASYGYSTRIISASIRHPLHVTRSALAGAHIATVPYKVLLQMFQHPLTDLGIKRFLEDWEQVRKK